MVTSNTTKTDYLMDIIKRIINDKRIFNTPYCPYDKRYLEEFFPNKEWMELYNYYKEGGENSYKELINRRHERIKKQYERNKLGNDLNKRYNALLHAYCKKRQLLEELFNTLEWYGVVECKLPNMDDFGIVIERHSKEEVITFFCDKINRTTRSYQKNALKAVLSYTMELYEIGIPKETIAYFIRKLDSLVEYWGLLDDE